MTVTIEDIVCTFIGDFEIADNVVRNANALRKLAENNENSVFNKLIVVQAGSIVEVCLAQIIYRAKFFTREGVPNISEEERKAIAGMTVEKFHNVIEAMRKYKILDGLGPEIYNELHKLRKYRNKVHIQDDVDIENIPRSEAAAFSTETASWALGLMVRVIKHLNEKFARPQHLEQFARKISVPSALSAK
jgi:hypothetical protein